MGSWRPLGSSGNGGLRSSGEELGSSEKELGSSRPVNKFVNELRASPLMS